MLVFVLVAVTGCEIPPEKPPLEVPPAVPSLIRVEPGEDLVFDDDLDAGSLELAVLRSLDYYQRLPDDRLFFFGGIPYTVQELKESLRDFLAIVKTSSTPAERSRKLRNTFDLYRSAAGTAGDAVLFTGYYAPILEGSLTQTPVFAYPLYRIPDDHIVIHLGRFDEKHAGERLIARLEGNEAVPYYTRGEIDIEQCLRGRGLELVWLTDPVDVFFLHIQGSGLVHLPDGRRLTVSYAQSNGHPYRSVGRLLMEREGLTPAQVSMRGIKEYLRERPDEMLRILAHNESYVFFRIVEEGPIGCLDVPVTPGRTIATDPAYFPQGALAFIRLKKPTVDDDGNIVDWVSFSRFALNQDAGGAIKGPRRVDLYCGDDAYAEIMAGHLRQEGELYFLVRKK